MQYLLLINEDESYYEGEAGAKRMQETIAGHMKLIEELTGSGIEWSGNHLQPAATATTIRWDHGKHTLHDGPHAETHEELGGYYLVDVADLDAALDWAKKIPIPAKGSVEVRPVFQD